MKKTAKDDGLLSKETFILKSNGTLAEKYLKIKLLGTGSYSKVYRVQSKTSKQIYACKQIQKSKITNIQNFKNEINILSKADHPNIVRLYEIFEDKRYVYLIMEECTGGELFDKINEKIDNDEVFTEKEASVIFKQLMSAISYCHSQGICHRDVKPENLLFLNKEKDSPIKLVDFGVSKIFGEIKPLVRGNKIEKNIMNCRVGTAYYISPEVLQGNYDYKCDIWSCGVILYLLLCGHPPFDGETENDIYKAILKKKYTFNEDEWKEISDEAKELIKHMICDADKRYNAENVLAHTWVEKNAPNAKESLNKVNLKNIQNYIHFSKLKKMALMYTAVHLGEKDINELKNAFEEIDANKDGTLSFEEFKNAFKKIEDSKKEKGEVDENNFEEIFNGMDTNKTEKIDYSEFITASMEYKTFIREEKLIDFFKMLDLDGSGKISKKEIKEAVCGEGMEDEIVDKVIAEFDLDGDGEIDFSEFVIGLSNASKKEEEIPEASKAQTMKKTHK